MQQSGVEAAATVAEVPGRRCGRGCAAVPDEASELVRRGSPPKTSPRSLTVLHEPAPFKDRYLA